jgi:transcriptional regulator with XRE-family HTH domain
MALSIGPTIKNLRKQLKITQDELAEAAGVSVAAVSKWESGKTYPDITLLPAIARKLKTTIDLLMGYASGPGQRELDNIVQKCSAEFDAGSFEKGYALCREYLARYPDEITLKLHIGALIPMYVRSLPPDRAVEYLAESLELCQPAASGNDPQLRLLGLRMLASIHLMAGHPDLASERYRESLTGLDGEADPVLAVILLKKGEVEKAEEMYQRCLFRAVNQGQTALLGLSGIAAGRNDERFYLKYLNAVPRLAALFELDRTPGLELNAYLSLMLHYAGKQKADKLLEALEGFLDSAGKWQADLDFSGNDFFHCLKSPGGGISYHNTLKGSFSQIAKELRGYSFLQGNPRFEELIGRLDDLRGCKG